jgi:hypothetical protein
MSSADLTELLRAARPVAPEALRERVRALASAPAPEPAAGRPLRGLRLPRLRLAVPALAATAVAAAALVAVVRPGGDTGREATPSQQLELTAPEATARAGVGGTGLAQPPSAKASPSAADRATGAAPAPGAGRAVDYQAQIGLRVDDADALSSATARAQTIARSLGGYVVSVQYASSESGSAALVLRVPTAKVQQAIGQLTALGTITSQQVQIQDLQDQLDGLAKQIAVLRSRIAHLTALLADPGITEERRATLRAERDRLQASLRSARQESAGVTRQAALATIQLTLATEEGSGSPVPASRVHRTVDELGRILAWEGIALLYALVVAGPFAVAGLLAWLAVRLRRRSSETRLLAER